MGAALGAALAFGAATGAGVAFSAVRLSRRALISAASLFLRSVSLAMLAVMEAIAFATLDTGAFLGAAFTTGLAAFAGAVVFLVVVAALGAVFFAVAIFKFHIVISDEGFRQTRIVSKLIACFLNRDLRATTYAFPHCKSQRLCCGLWHERDVQRAAFTRSSLGICLKVHHAHAPVQHRAV